MCHKYLIHPYNPELIECHKLEECSARARAAPDAAAPAPAEAPAAASGVDAAEEPAGGGDGAGDGGAAEQKGDGGVEAVAAALGEVALDGK